jgi:hypothetical protein
MVPSMDDNTSADREASEGRQHEELAAIAIRSIVDSIVVNTRRHVLLPALMRHRCSHCP